MWHLFYALFSSFSNSCLKTRVLEGKVRRFGFRVCLAVHMLYSLRQIALADVPQFPCLQNKNIFGVLVFEVNSIADTQCVLPLL